jgi:hypothetical protein
MKTRPITGNLRDQLFVLTWVVLAVAAKYSVSYFTPAPTAAHTIDTGLADAAADGSTAPDVETVVLQDR